MKILITGSAGFIGFHLSRSLLADGYSVVGIDSLNKYYDPKLKKERNAILKRSKGYTFHKSDITKFKSLSKIFRAEKPDHIVHLAAQAGVRYSILNPWACETANILGTTNVFEAAKDAGVKRVVFASSSSVYGLNMKTPFKESDMTDSPVSPYAATKKSAELMAHAYHKLYGIEMAGLRFFTVYGEYGRPDMAMSIFAKGVFEGTPIKLFGNGKMVRDFTHVDDIVKGIKAVLRKKGAGFEIYNLGAGNPSELGLVVSCLEKGLGKKAIVERLPMQPGDVEATWADISKARNELGFDPKVEIREGIGRFAKWYLENRNRK